MVLPCGAVRGAGRPLLERPASLHLAPASTIPRIQQVLSWHIQETEARETWNHLRPPPLAYVGIWVL